MRILLLIAAILIAAASLFGQTTTKTVTNADLEQIRQKRLQAEEEYRRTYKERGLPSPEELDKQRAERRAWLEEYNKRQSVQTARDNTDIEYRARSLRSEIAGNAAQINYLRTVTARIPANSNVIDVSQLGQIGTFYSYQPGVQWGVYGGYSRGRGGYNRNSGAVIMPQQPRTDNPALASALATHNLSAAANLDPNYLRGNTVSRSRYGRYPARRGGIVLGGYYYPGYYQGYGFALPANNNQLQREELVSRLRVLEQQRAGLLAQWKQLVDEAWSAGLRIE
jgi:ABC-type antimicrobial peptide transport system permease subunit